MKKHPIIWITAILLLAASVTALGIRPAKTTVNFEPDLEKNYTFSIVNNEEKDLSLYLSAEGVLRDYISLPQETINISALEPLKEVAFSLDLPGALVPGSNLGKITITEKPGEISPISANLQLAHKVYVIAPYPEKYVDVDISLRIREAKSDILTEIRNSGTRNISRLSALIRVLDNGKIIGKLETEPISLETTKTKQYYLTLNRTLMPNGEYDVYAQIFYDSEEMETSKKILVGEPEIEIINLNKYFLENEVNEFKIQLKNNWNKEIRDIYADILVQKDSQEIYSSKTVSFDLKGRETDVLQTYLDLTSLSAGEADLSITLNYKNKKQEHDYLIKTLVPREYNEKRKEIEVVTMPGGKYTYALITIIAILVFIAFLVIVIPSVRKRKEEEKLGQSPKQNLPKNQWNQNQK